MTLAFRPGPGPACVQGARILAVDDDPSILVHLEAIVEVAGWGTIRGIEDPRQAAEIVRSWAPDLLLVDLRMPGMSGLELIERLRAEHGASAPPIVVLTADTDRTAKVKALRAGAWDYISKPIDRDELVARVTGILERQVLQRSLAASNERLETAVVERTRQLMGALDAAQQAERTQNRFLGLISHEFRTPLNAVIGFSELLLSPAGRLMRAQESEYLGCVLRSGRQLLRLIDRVLFYAHLGSLGTRTGEAVALATVVEGVTRAMAAELRAKRMALMVTNGASGTMVRFDAPILERALTEILDNAIRFAPAGSRISVDIRDSGASADLRLAISNEGPGMSEAAREAALAPFGVERDSWLSDDGRGLGLGLPIAKRIIELHGGTLEIGSADGVGTCVTLIVPAARRLASPPSGWAAPTPGGRAVEPVAHV